MRVSGTDWAEGGWDLDQTIAFAKALAARGCSAIHVSSGGMTPAQKWFRRWTTEIAVTDRRVILKRGFIRRATMEMNLAKVESVDVDQTLSGRLFNYGNVTIRGTGSSFEILRTIDAPLKLRSTVTAG